jgi:hypothetical protein
VAFNVSEMQHKSAKAAKFQVSEAIRVRESILSERMQLQGGTFRLNVSSTQHKPVKAAQR